MYGGALNQPTSGLLASAVAAAFALAGCTIGLAAMMSPALSGATAEVALIPAVLGAALSLAVWPLRLGMRALIGVAIALLALLAVAAMLPIAFVLLPVLAYASPWWMLTGCAAFALLYSVFAVAMAGPNLTPRRRLALLIVPTATLLLAAAVASAFREGDIVYTLDVARTRFAMAMNPALSLILGVTSGWLGLVLSRARDVEPAPATDIELALRADGQNR